VRQAGPREKAALGTRRRRTAIIHRTVRWCTGLSGESSAANSSPSGNAKGRRGYNLPDCPVSQRSPVQRSATQSAGDAWPAATVGWTHRTVSGAPTDPEDQRSDAPEKEGDRAPDSYSDCPVVHRTVRCTTRQNARIAFHVDLTAPSCLGAIKGTPRRMEEVPKHSLSILKHPDSAPTHLILCVSDLNSI
jgi:hypothetical protein